jgi:sugar O-acyltransferase (sialic acid O-acetyltransferase NeuD family)
LKLLIMGAGGHGRVVADAAESTTDSWSEIVFLDDRYPELTSAGAWRVLGKFGELRRLADQYRACVVAVGDAALRVRLLQSAAEVGLMLPPIVHLHASVSPYASLAPGCVVAAGAVVGVGATLARGCIVNTGATVDHDCRLSEGVHVCPGAHLAGNVELGARTWFGIGAVARQGVRIGADVTVGAGAVCLQSIPDGVTVSGVPARERAT